MREIARWADIPLINLQCDVDHPTQTLADLMTLRETRGDDLRGLQRRRLVGLRAVVREADVGAPGRSRRSSRASAWTSSSPTRPASS